MGWMKHLLRSLRLLTPAVLIFLGCATVVRAQAGGTGYWHTSGSRILDGQGRQVRIAGVNWYGFETSSFVPGGLYAQDYRQVMRTIREQGFNTIRLPLSSETIENPGHANNISFYNQLGTINSDLKGLNSLEVLDHIVSYAGQLGLKVILDHHRSEAGNTAEANGLWYTDAYPESAWIADWVTLAARYRGQPAVIGFDLHNEPHAGKTGGGACWDCGGPGDWHLAAERAGNAVLAANPDLLVFVEGVDSYRGDYYWWGGNLEGVAQSPVVLETAGHLVYSAHDYGPHEQAQRWFNGATTQASLADVWMKHWGYIALQGIAPVWLGEFGTTNADLDLRDSAPGSQGQWFQSLVSFLNANPDLNWSYWAVNGEDGYGLLANSYSAVPASPLKVAMLASSSSAPNFHAAPAPPLLARASAAGFAPGGSAKNRGNAGWAMIMASCLTFALVVTKKSSGGEEDGAEPDDPESEPVVLCLPPEGLSAVVKSETQIRVRWQECGIPEYGPVTYNLYAGTRADHVRSLVASGLTEARYLVARLQPGSEYFFRVVTVQQGIASPLSEVIAAVTLGEKPVAEVEAVDDAAEVSAEPFVAAVFETAADVSKQTTEAIQRIDPDAVHPEPGPVKLFAAVEIVLENVEVTVLASHDQPAAAEGETANEAVNMEEPVPPELVEA